MKDGQFIKKVYKDEFGVLEQEMKEILIGDKIAKLDLK